jgi:TolA-binding protein
MDGPESPYLCASYYYLGELFKKEGQIAQAKAIFSKICQIWVKHILNEDFEE